MSKRVSEDETRVKTGVMLGGVRGTKFMANYVASLKEE